MSAATELWSLSATDLVLMLKEGLVTPLQLVQAASQRIEATDPWVNAVPIKCFERAKERAANWKSHTHSSRSGYLHGLPILVKDLTAVKGLPFTLVSPVALLYVST